MDFSQWMRAVAAVMGAAMTPILEVKAAIPLGTAMGLPLWAGFAAALIGSMIPVPFVLLFLRPILKWLKTTRILGWFGRFMERHVSKKSGQVRKYSLLGLFLLVALPVPTTGVWTGAMVAALLDLRIKHALPVIFAGNLVCSLCILWLTGVFVS